MVSNSVSTLSLWSSPRAAVADHQSAMVRANREVTTGRLDDPGRVLGGRIARTVELRAEDGLIGRLITANGVAEARMRQIQGALDVVVEGATRILGSLTALPPSSNAVEALISDGGNALDELVATLNAGSGRTFLFAGINATVPPMEPYSGAPSAAVDAAVLAAFGSPTIPAATTPAAIGAFLAGDFAALFADPAWGTDWSSASNVNITNEIEPGRVLQTSISANEQPFRDLAMAYTMISKLGIDGLRSDTRQVVVDAAIELIGLAVADVVQLQAELGLTQNAAATATARMQADQQLILQKLDAYEGRDPAEAKIELDRLTLQIEMSYALTARLSRLSILNYA